MLFMHPSRPLPHTTLFPELTFAHQLEDGAVNLLRGYVETIGLLSYRVEAGGIRVEEQPPPQRGDVAVNQLRGNRNVETIGMLNNPVGAGGIRVEEQPPPQ
jgi:hypothetical protein